MRAASPPWLGRDAITVRPTDAGPRFSPQRAAPWNRTWLKRDATELAEGTAASGNERLPAIAAWNVGAGAVVAAAFTPSPALVDALVDRVAAPPRDPRFRVTHHAGRELRVTLDAIDKRAGAGAGAGSNPGGYMNHLAPRLEFSGDATRSSDAIAMPQTAPGRYEVTLPASPVGAFATVRVQGRVVERFVVAGRYPPEFEAIGNDRSAMEALARASGGGVIEPAHTSPIDFRWPTRAILLSAYLAAAGGALIVGGLVRWRI